MQSTVGTKAKKILEEQQSFLEEFEKRRNEEKEELRKILEE